MNNLGIELEELMELLSSGHEAVFSLDGEEFIIQTESAEMDQSDLVLYQYKPTVNYLCRVPNGEGAIVTVLNAKCIHGRSFMDLLKNIHVDEIF